MTKKEFAELYPVLRDISLGRRDRPRGIGVLYQKYGMNDGTAIIYINNFRHMLKGTVYKRAMSKVATKHILTMIDKELAPSVLMNAVKALWLHLHYKKGQPGIEKIAAHFQKIVDAKWSNAPAAVKKLKSTRAELDKEGGYDPSDDEDEREWVMRLIAKRQGQSKFRNKLLKAYRGRCAISGCRVLNVLEAAHIKGYHGPKSDHTSNGLLLRTDLHTLFDLHLITMDPETWDVLISPELKGSVYEKFAGKKLRLPKNPKKRPNKERLAWHREESKL
jgi:hypothetical protein